MLVLLIDTRKKLLWLWLIFTAIIVVLMFIQTINGKFEDIETNAWTWAFTNLLSPLLLLIVAILMNKNPSKVLLSATFRIIYMATLTYLLLVSLSLLALPIATRNQSIEVYFNQSYLWLLPFQGIILIIFGILYFKKETYFRPNAAIMQEFMVKKAEFAQRNGRGLQTLAFNLLIAEQKMAEVLDFLKAHLKGNMNDIILLQSQYMEWQHQRDLNLVSTEELQRTMNRLTLAVINYIEKL